MKEFKSLAIVFFCQIAYYSLITMSMRAAVAGNYMHVALLDFSLATMAFFVIRRLIVSESSIKLWLSYSLGGLIGSMCGIFISKNFL